jgi:hypothetical protein
MAPGSGPADATEEPAGPARVIRTTPPPDSQAGYAEPWEQPDAGPQPASTGDAGVHATTQSPPAYPKAERPRRRDQLLWLWPAVALVIVAGAGSIWGLLGVIIGAAVTVATLALFVGDVILSPGIRLGITVAAVLAVAATLVARQQDAAFFAAKSPAPGRTAAASAPAPVLDLRGKRVTLAELQGKSLRGALLGGANLDGLDLYGLNLAGIVAPGATFRSAILDRADLAGADLQGAVLADSCLHGANLTGANLDGVNAAGADVTDVRVSRLAIKQAAVWPRKRGFAAAARCG